VVGRIGERESQAKVARTWMPTKIPQETQKMAAKKKTTTSITNDSATLKFSKGGFYQDQAGALWCCASGKTKTIGDNELVSMRRTEAGQTVGDATDDLTESFTKQLTGAELKEYREVLHREREAEEATVTVSKPTKSTKYTKTCAESDVLPKACAAKPSTDKFKRMSALDAAAKVLGESTEPMATKEMIDAMSAKSYWTSPGGQTPHATLYAAILREINVKGREARFTKTDRGRFALVTQTGFEAVEEPQPVEQGTGNDDKPETVVVDRDVAVEVAR
jgi:hypothetical protein